MNILIAPYQEDLFRFRSDSTLARSVSDYFIPDSISGLKMAPVLCIRAQRAGKAIQPRFAERYIGSFLFGIILYPELEDQDSANREFAENSLDDTSIIPLLSFPAQELEQKLKAVQFQVLVNGLEHFPNMEFPDTEKILNKVSEISGYCSIRIGDYIFFELSSRKKIAAGEHITSYVDGEKIIDLQIR